MLSAEVINKKFDIREFLKFLIFKKEKVVLDNDILFELSEYNQYLGGKKIKGVSTVQMEEILNDLSRFKQRTKNLKMITPPEPLFQFEVNNQYIVTGSNTQALKNALRYIDSSIYLTERPEKIRNKSLFNITQDGKLKFSNKISPRSLGNKEKAIFLHLRNNYNHFCTYGELFEKAKIAIGPVSNIGNKYRSAKEKRKYIYNGIEELQNKLLQISGNPDIIDKSQNRKAEFRLKY